MRAGHRAGLAQRRERDRGGTAGDEPWGDRAGRAASEEAGAGIGRGIDGSLTRGTGVAPEASNAGACARAQRAEPTAAMASASPISTVPAIWRTRSRLRPGAPRVSSSASRMARADAKRAAGFFAMAQTTTASTARGVGRWGVRARGGSGVSWSCLPMTSTLDEPSNAVSPVSIS